MRNLFQLFVRYHNFFLFLLLEAVAFLLIAQFNTYHKSKVVTLSATYAGNLYSVSSSVTDYFHLKKANEQLSEENAKLKNFLLQSNRDEYSTYHFNDSLIADYFWFRNARVIQNTTYKHKNYITLNKGAIDGITPGMAVMGKQGVVGSVKGVSKNFAVVIPIINLSSQISAKIDSSGYFGSLMWDGKDYRTAKLMDIEQNAKISLGQKVVTTGFGSFFPENLLIGTISKIRKDAEGIFYNIDVELATDFKQLYHVEIIENLKMDEINQLEAEEADE